MNCSFDVRIVFRVQVNKNAFLLKEIDELFQKGRDGVSNSALKGLMQKVFFFILKKCSR